MSRKIVLTAALLAAIPLAGVARAQDKPPANPPTAPQQNEKDVAAAAYIKETGATMSKMADQDAKAAIKKLLDIWKDKDVTDATKKPVPDMLEHFGREEKALVAIDAIDALGELGATAGANPVLAILDHALKAKDPSVDIYGTCLRALKKLADPRKATVGKLTDLLTHRMDDVVGKAADAMSGYKDAPGKVRRDMLEELIKQTEGVCAQAKDPKNAAQGRKWGIISSGVMNALKALSGQSFKDVQEARKWYNDHKKDKSWDT